MSYAFPTGGWGCITGIDLHALLAVYGTPSGTAPLPRWTLGPNPGGAPAIGNSAFSVTSSSTPGAVYLWVLGFTSANQLLPFQPALTLLTTPVISVLTPGNSLPLPIPGDPTLTGTVLFAQCGVVATALAATAGLRMTVL